jgi:IS6 family transposase
MSEFKWRQFEGEIILWAVRWYCRYGISYRDLEQMMAIFAQRLEKVKL